jgi:hypothetical protein
MFLQSERQSGAKSRKNTGKRAEPEPGAKPRLGALIGVSHNSVPDPSTPANLFRPFGSLALPSPKLTSVVAFRQIRPLMKQLFP